MKPPLPRILSDVPRTLHAQLEVAKAIRTLIGPDEDELVRQRDDEIAVIRRDLEALARDIPNVFEAAAKAAKAETFAALRKYSPDQPRVPGGSRDGGQWTREEGSSGTHDWLSSLGANADSHHINTSSPVYNDPRILSDATPDNAWIPGAQYAGGIESEGENRNVGSWPEATPAQEARLAIAEARWESFRTQVRIIDPYWRPTPGVYETIEGGIADLEAKAQEAQAHITQLAAKGIGPGPFACESIPARGPDRGLNTSEREQNNENGAEYGCHTCGTKTPGTPLGNWVGDHQPPNGLNIFGTPQRIYPQCLSCSLRQGGFISQRLNGLR
jgi:hypothetical protein